MKAIPSAYKAMVLKCPGPVTNFELQTLPIKKPTGREVLVKVAACAVAYRDVLDRKGAFKFIKRPTVLGHEFSGVVVDKGPDAKDFAIGEKVLSLHWDQHSAWPSPLKGDTGAVNSMFALTCDGGYAEYCTAQEGSFVAKPKHMNMEQGACVMSTFGTVWCGAVVRGALQPGQRTLVTGASGGVGSSAVSIFKSMKCHVTGITSNESKVPFLKDVGCDDIIISPDGKFKPKSQYDLVMECVGGPTFTSSLRSVTPGGKLVLVGNVENSVVQLPLGLCILNSLSIVGSDSIKRSDMADCMNPFLEEHNLLPRIDRIVDLEQAGEAHSLLESKSVQGRVVLSIDKSLN